MSSSIRSPDLSPADVRELFDYCAESGQLLWRKRTSNRVCVGAHAGYVDKRGAKQIRIFGRLYQAHRLVWAHAFGEWPREEIDHRDCDPSNNRIGNLRDVSHAINHQNERRPRSGNRSGFLGVSPDKSRWVATLSTGGQKLHVGSFSTPHEAHQAYVAAKRAAHPGCTL